MQTTYYLGIPASKAAPTKAHRPAIWECMLGTVYAMSPDGEARYFDYDHTAALQWAQIDGPDADLRVARVKVYRNYVRSGATESSPLIGRLVLWAKR